MYGRQPKSLSFSLPKALIQPLYQAHLQTRLGELQTFVIVTAATAQKAAYGTYSTMQNFQVHDPVWLSIPTSCKLDSKREGGWMVKTIKSPVNMEITDGKVIHINRLQHRVQRLCKKIPDIPATDTQIWESPWAEHITKANAIAPSIRRYPLRERQPPSRLEYYN